MKSSFYRQANEALTLEENIKYKIPEGTQPGTIFRIKAIFWRDMTCGLGRIIYVPFVKVYNIRSFICHRHISSLAERQRTIGILLVLPGKGHSLGAFRMEGALKLGTHLFCVCGLMGFLHH